MKTTAIEYAEYKDVVDILNKSDPDQAYQDLVKKEDKVLDTVNNVVKYYTDKSFAKGDFTQQSVLDVVANFFTVWGLILKELSENKDPAKIFTKDDRLIYIGIMVLVVAFILFFIHIVK